MSENSQFRFKNRFNDFRLYMLKEEGYKWEQQKVYKFKQFINYCYKKITNKI